MTPIPWKHVQVVNDDGSNLTAEQVGEYVAKTFSNGVRSEFHAIQAVKEDGKVYDVCHVGNGPDSPWNAAGITKAVNYHHRLVDALKDCSTELSEALEAKYHGILGYPSTDRDYRTDMAVVAVVRALLKELEE